MKSYSEWEKERATKKEGTLSSSSSKMSYSSWEKDRGIGLSNLQDDYRMTTEALNKVYSGWTDKDTMSVTYDAVSKMSDRLKKYKTMGTFDDSQMKDLDNIIGYYDSALANWENISNTYGQYKTAKSYDRAVKKSELSSKYAGSTYEQIQDALSNASDLTEKDFLETFTDYSTSKDFQKAIEGTTSQAVRDKLTQKMNNNKLMNAFNEYKALEQNANFAEMSQYTPVDPKLVGDYNETRYRNINNPGQYGGYGLEDDMYYLERMPEEYKAVGNYIYNTQGSRVYGAYLDAITQQVRKELTDPYREKYTEWTDQNFLTGLAGTLGNAAISVATLPGLAGEKLQGFVDGNGNPYGISSVAHKTASESSAAISENIRESVPNVGGNMLSMGYDAITSGVLSRAGQVFFGPTYTALMGTAAYSDTLIDSLEKGIDPQKAMLTAGAAGIAETFFEYCSLEQWNKLKVSDATSAKKIIENIFKQFITEGSEEVATDIANAITDQLINKENSDLFGNYDDYIARGYSEEEAKTKVKWDFINDVVRSFTVGGLSGGMSAGIGSTYEYGVNKRLGGNVNTERYGEAVKGLGEDSKVYQDYLALADQTDNFRNPGKTTQAELGANFRKAYSEASKNFEAASEKNMDEAVFHRETIGMLEDSRKTYTERAFDAINKKAQKDAKAVKKDLSIKDGAEKANVTDVISSEDGIKLTIDGKEVDAKSVNLNANQAEIVAEATNISDEDKRQAFLKNYAGGNAELYSTRFEILFTAAQSGVSLDEAVETIGSGMSELQSTSIYDAGQKFYFAEPGKIEEAQAPVFKDMAKNFKSGTFDESGIKGVRLSTKEKLYKQYAKVWSALGVNVKLIYDTSSKSINGQYTSEDNTITINLAARYGASYNYSTDKAFVVSTMSHELTHWMRSNDTIGAYSTIKDALTAFYKSKGAKSFDDYVDDHIKGHEDKHKHKGKWDEGYSEMSRDTAEEEVVARACEDMLNDSKTMDEILSSMNETELKTFRDAIIEFFNKIREKFEELMSGFRSESAEAKALRDDMEAFENIRKEWVKGIQNALKVNQARNAEIEAIKNGIKANNQQATNAVFGGEIYTANEVAQSKDSIKMNDELGKKSIAENAKLKNVDARVLVNSIGKRQAVARRLKQLEYLLPEDIAGEALVKNSSYNRSVEHALICVRSLVNNWFVDQVAEAVGRPLTVEEQIVCSEILAGKVGNQRECQYCYVAADRKSTRAALGTYFIMYNGVLEDVKKNKKSYQAEYDFIVKNPRDFERMQAEYNKPSKERDESVYKGKIDHYLDFLAGKKATPNMSKRFVKFVEEGLNGKQTLEVSDLTTDAKIQSLMNTDKKWFLADAKDYAQKAAWGKKTFRSLKINGKKINLEYVAYNGSILKMKEKDIEMLNHDFGLRMYSDSDYVPGFILEDMQIITDSAVRGLKMLAYTKDIGYVKVFAPSGIGINISTYGTLDKAIESDKAFQKIKADYLLKRDASTRKAYLDAMSKYVLSDAMQGAEWEEVKKMRDQYDNVGAVFVATNDDLVEWAMAQPWIDVVIPYHLVRAGQEVQAYFKYTNYKGEQEDKKTKDWHEGNLKSIPPTVHGNDYQRYLQALKDNNLTPRFARFQDNPNYMKLVNETRLSYDSLNPVQPEFGWEYVNDELDRIAKEGKYGFMQGYDTEEEQRQSLDADLKEAVSAISTGNLDKYKASEKIDDEYMELAKDPVKNKKKLQAMVDEAAKREGFNVKAYHGTSNGGFTRFITDTIDNNMGSHFGSEEIAKGFASDEWGGSGDNNQIYSVYLKSQNPYVTYDWFGQDDFYPAFEALEMANQIGTEEASKIADEILALDPKLKEMYEEDDYNEGYLSKAKATVLYRDIRRLLDLGGYDSIQYENGLEVVGDTNWIIQHPEQIKSADPVTYDDNGNVIPLSQRFDIENKDIRYSDKVETAPVFYSQMAKEISTIKGEKIGAASVIPYLKGKGIKDEEIKWSGIATFLEGKKSVSKEELQAFADNSMLNIEEKTLRSLSDNEFNKLWGDVNDLLRKHKLKHDVYDYFDYSDEFEERKFREDLEWDLDDKLITQKEFDSILEAAKRADERTGKDNVRWDQYKLKGGTNYREMLFRIPGSDYSNQAMKTHWGDNKGVIAHTRLQDFDTADMGRMLFVEEIQSDWHNAGKKNGYLEGTKKTKDKEFYKKEIDKVNSDFQNEKSIEKKIMSAGYKDAGVAMIFNYLIDNEQGDKTISLLERKGAKFTDKDRDIIKSYQEKYLDLYNKWEASPSINLVAPDAPFKNYTDFVVKRLIRMAAEEGYDSIGWTTGKMQEERWSSEYAEGYRIEYDQDIPKFINKYGKQWGAKAVKTPLGLEGLVRQLRVASQNKGVEWDEARGNEWGVPLVHAMALTDSMKDSVLTKGQPMFSEKYEVTDISDAQYKELKDHFGTTNNFNVAGYLLKDGAMLDFSGKHWGDDTSNSRQVDHRDISEVLPTSHNGYDSMVNMISNGNIRLMPENGGLNLSEMPTESQKRRLQRFFDNSFRNEGQVIVDIDEKGGNTVKSLVYNERVSAERIFMDIEDYFRNGEQKVSDLMAFHTMFSEKIEGKEVSNEMYDAYIKLSSGIKVNEETLLMIPEIVEAVKKLPDGSSDNIHTKEREELRRQIAENYLKLGSWVSSEGLDDFSHGSYSGDVERGSKIALVIGLPASGKSSAAVNPISAYLKARVLDSDDIKKMLPEYGNGYGSGYVHEESKKILNNVEVQALKTGENIVKPIVGGNLSKLIKAINRYDALGYEVSLCLVDLESSKAISRVLSRFIKEGRYIPIDVVYRYQNKPTENYETLRGENYEGISSFAKISNDVSFGEKPVFIEGEGSLKTVFGGRGQSRRRAGQDATGSNKREKFSEKVGYHAGDLGKSEPLSNMSGSRGTGHFGTGTYFVGDPEKIKGYNKRDGVEAPVHTVDFSKYNLFRPRSNDDGFDLHDFLKKVNTYYDMPEDAIKSVREYEKRLDELDQMEFDAYYDEDSDYVLDFEKAYDLASKIYGKHRVNDAIAKATNWRYGSVSNGTLWDNDSNKSVTVEELTLSDAEKEEMFVQLRQNSDDYELKRQVEKYEDFLESMYKPGWILGISEDKVREVYNEVVKELRDANISYDDSKTSDSASTRFMKKLGYEGIDVSGLSLLDNTTYGSVIYDLKGEDLERKNAIGTARFSEKVEDDRYKLIGENERLAKQNKKLAQDVKDLKELVRLSYQKTNGKVWKPTELTTAANSLLKIADSNMSNEELRKDLADLYDRMTSWFSQDMVNGEQADLDYIMAQCEDVAEKLIETSNYKPVSDRRIASEIKKSNVELGDAKDEITAELSAMISTLDAEDRLRNMAIQIYNKYWTVSKIKTATDIQTENANDKVNQINAENAARIKELNLNHTKAMNEALDNQRLADRIHYGKIINELKQDRERKISEIKETNKKRKADAKDAAERRAEISRITDVSLTLNKWMKENNAKKHVPEALKAPIARLISAIDFSSKQLLGLNKGEKNLGVPTQKDVSLRKALEMIHSMALENQNNMTDEALENNAFSELDLPENFAEEVDKLYKSVVELSIEAGNDNGYVLQMMSLEDLKRLRLAMTAVKKAVTQINQMLSVSNAHSMDYYAQDTINESNALGQIKGGKVREFFRDFMQYGEGTPYYVFKRFGKGAEFIFHSLQLGQDQYAKEVKKIIDFTKSLYDAEDSKRWEKEVHTFTVLDENGKNIEVKLTTAQLMSLYCLGKREQAQTHLYGGGIRIADFKEGRKSVTQPKAFILTHETMDTMMAELHKDSKAVEVAKGLQNFMNTVCSDWGNEITMKRFGINGFTEKNYFPIRSDENVLNVSAQDKQSSIYAMLNMSFTKPLTKNANNQIVIDDIFEVFANHSSSMAKYNSMALPVLDTIKWWNYKEKADKNEDGAFTTASVRTSLESAFGKGANRYIRTFLDDVNGTKKKGRMDTIGGKLLSLYKTSAVGANLQVALLQPISYLRAINTIERKYLIKALGYVNEIKKLQAECSERCGMAIWKDLGFFETDVSRGVTELIKNNATVKDTLVEKSMSLASKMDSITWGFLWKACQLETIERDHIPYGTGAFWQTVEEKMRKTIYATQVVDSTLTRSQFMRGSDMYTKLTTAFLSEPTLSINVLMDAFSDFSKDQRKTGNFQEAFHRNGKKIAIAAESYVLCATVESILRGVITTARNGGGDEDETMLDNIVASFKDQINPIGMIPIAKDVLSMAQGYSASRMDEEAIQQAVYAYKAIMKSIETGEVSYKTVYTSMRAISMATGIPISAMSKELVTIWNNTIGRQYPDLVLK